MLRVIKMKSLSIATLIALCGLIMFTGCKKSETTEPEKDAQGWIDNGWQQFEAKKYSEAADSFSKAVNLNPVDSVAAIAYCGLGWSQVRLFNYDLAFNNFTFAIIRDSVSPGPYIVHAYVGRAGIMHKKNIYGNAIADAAKALGINGTYEFTHDRSIKFTGLHFILAEAYYHTQQYTLAQQKVDWLRNLFAMPAIVWTGRPAYVVDGVSYSTYYEALLKAIEGLRDKV